VLDYEVQELRGQFEQRDDVSIQLLSLRHIGAFAVPNIDVDPPQVLGSLLRNILDSPDTWGWMLNGFCFHALGVG